MILKEINQQLEKEWRNNRILEIININLPDNYKIEKIGDSLAIVSGTFFKKEIAELKFKDEVIDIYFTDESDLEILRDCLQNSTNKFNVFIGSSYY
jgi:hypothetical protein